MPEPAKSANSGYSSFWPRRARGPRLYLPDGRRLLDLWLDGGRAVLGHKCEGILLAYKNAAERGLTASWPGHPLNNRAKKTLESFFAPLFTDEPEARPLALFCRDSRHLERAIAALGVTPEPWRPWMGQALKTPPHAFEGLLVPVLPLSLPGLPPVILASRALYDDALKRGQTEADEPLEPVYPAPALLAAIIRAFELLERSGERDLTVVCPRLASFLAAQDTSAKLHGAPPAAEGSFPPLFWHARGSWLYPDPLPEARHWEYLCDEAFSRGLYLPPDPRDPLCVSPGFSDGEAALLVQFLSSTASPPCARASSR